MGRGAAEPPAIDGWSGKRDLNPRLRPWQGRTLPLSYSRSTPGLPGGGEKYQRPGCPSSGADGVPEDTDACDLDLAAVPRPQGADAWRGASGDEIAREKRHDVRDERDELGNREDHVGGWALLAH